MLRRAFSSILCWLSGRCRQCGTLALALLVGALGNRASAEPEIRVTLKSGRTFAGFPDDATDGKQLVLRFEAGQAQLLRPIRWSQVVTAEVERQTLTPEDLLAQIERWRAEQPWELIAPLDRASRPTDRVAEAVKLPRQDQMEGHVIFANSATHPARIVALRIEAEDASWQAGAEIDGLVVRVYPLDEFGRTAAVEGTLNVTLIGSRPAALTGEFFYDAGAPFPRLGYWTRALTPPDFAGHEARLVFPFQAAHPQFQLDLGPLALVTAELVVPGQGVFTATDDFVRIRPYSPMRDWLQQFEGRRFFPAERTWRTQ